MAFYDTYKGLLGTVQNRDYTLNLENVGIPSLELQELEAVFTEEEVWAVIREMPPDRAPGPDGFMGAFYQRVWHIIKHDIMAVLLKLYVGNGRGFGKLNTTLITLITKKKEA